MIYTVHHEKVEIVSVESSIIDLRVKVRSLGTPSWEREKYVYQLNADGGLEEIREAIEKITKGGIL